MALGRCCKCDEADAARMPVHGWVHYRPLWPAYREPMLAAHFPHDCGVGMVREGGRWYPVDYLARLLRDGEKYLHLDEEK